MAFQILIGDNLALALFAILSIHSHCEPFDDTHTLQRRSRVYSAFMYTYRTSFTKRIPARLTVAGVAFRREWISKIILMVAVSGMRSLDTRVNTCRHTDGVAKELSLQGWKTT